MREETMDCPETPEAVALALLDRILEREEPQPGANRPREQRLLDLYARCLAAANGRHETSTLH